MKRKGLCLIMVLCMLAGCAQAGGGNGGAAAEAPAEEEQAGSGLTEEQSAGEDLSRDGLSEDNLSWEEAGIHTLWKISLSGDLYAGEDDRGKQLQHAGGRYL